MDKFCPYKVYHVICNLWNAYLFSYNFFFSNPTIALDNLVNAHWPVVGSNQANIDFANEIIPGQRPFAERMAFWADLQARYAPDAP